MRFSPRLVAGVLDSGFSSLATFTIGIFAVRLLVPPGLGAYALCYQALFLVGILPQNLIFVPAQVALTALPPERRLDHLGRSLLLGLPIASLAGLASAAWLLIAPPEITSATLRALTLTAVPSAILSPVQDHVRLMLHSGGASWSAAAVSVVQLLVSVLLLVSALVLSVPSPWVPFGTLAIANLVSLSVGLLLARRRPVRGADPSLLRASELVRSGRWVLAGAALAPAGAFVAAALVSRLASAAALGYAEAARVLSQPVWVLGLGLVAVMGPSLMEAARAGDRAAARRTTRLYFLLVILGGIANLALLGGAWPWNPLAWLLPTAYAVPGLVAASILAQASSAMSLPYRSQLLGGQREVTLTRIEIAANAARLAVAATAVRTRSFAIPLSLLTLGVTRMIAYRGVLADIYARAPLPGSPHGTAPVDAA